MLLHRLHKFECNSDFSYLKNTANPKQIFSLFQLNAVCTQNGKSDTHKTQDIFPILFAKVPMILEPSEMSHNKV